MKDIHYIFWVLCWLPKTCPFSILTSELVFTVYPPPRPWMLSQHGKRKKIHSSMKKIGLSQYKGDMIPFSIGYNFTKKCKTCWPQRKQGCQNNHARLLAWPFTFFLLFSSSEQLKLVRRMAQNIKTYFAMRKLY